MRRSTIWASSSSAAAKAKCTGKSFLPRARTERRRSKRLRAVACVRPQAERREQAVDLVLLQVLRRIDRADLNAGGGPACGARAQSCSGRRSGHARNIHAGSIAHPRSLGKGGERTVGAKRRRVRRPPVRREALGLIAVALWPGAAFAQRPPAGTAETTVTVDSSRRRIVGTLAIPPGAGRCPVVLIIAGSGPTRTKNLRPL